MSEKDIKTTAEEASEDSADVSEEVKSEKTNQTEKTMSGKNKFRITSIVITALVLAAVIVLNVIAYVLTDRFSSLTVDITSNGTYQLSDATEKIIKGVKQKVSITFLTDRNTYSSLDEYYKQTLFLVDKMSKDSEGLVSVEFINIVSNPNFLNNYADDNLTTSDVIIKCGDKYNVLRKEDMYNFEFMDEQYQYISSSKAESAIDTAIVKVTSERSDKVILLTDNTEEDYSYLVKVLSANNYNVTEMEIEKADIPENINTVIAFAPTKDYSEGAAEKLRSFLYNEGNYSKSMIYVACSSKVDCPNITALLKDYGMAISDGLAFDMDTSRQLNTVSSYSAYGYIAASFVSKLFTDNILENNQTVLANNARAVTSLSEKAATPLICYSASSGICPFDATSDWNPQDYIIGNVNIMMQGISGDDKAQSKLIVSGSADMWSETVMKSQFANQEYMLNIMANLNHRQNNTVNLDNKVITEYSLQNISRQTSVLVGMVMYAFIPLAILGAGITVFIIRRRK